MTCVEYTKGTGPVGRIVVVVGRAGRRYGLAKGFCVVKAGIITGSVDVSFSGLGVVETRIGLLVDLTGLAVVNIWSGVAGTEMGGTVIGNGFISPVVGLVVIGLGLFVGFLRSGLRFGGGGGPVTFTGLLPGLAK